MAIAYTKDIIERAKADDKYIVQVSIDGKYLRKESAEKYQKTFMGHARFQITGPMEYQQAKELWDWHRKWQKKNAKRRAVAKGGTND